MRVRDGDAPRGDESAEGVFTWRLSAELVSSVARDQSLESQCFSLGGRAFCLRFFPKGIVQSHRECCSLFLLPREAVRVQLRLHVGGTAKAMDAGGPVQLRAGEPRGWVNFGPVRGAGAVTLQAELLHIFEEPLRWQLPTRYELGRVLGSGDFATVREAWDGEAHRWVAVKQMQDFLGAGDACVLRELTLLAGLQHEHVARVFDLLLGGPWGPTGCCDLHVVMECCDMNLEKVCSQRRGVSLLEARRMAYGLVSGCSFLHAAGICHRDLKPANCLVNADCCVKVCDFNLARSPDVRGAWTDASGEGEGAPSPKLPASGRWYRPPEVILRLAYSQAIDVWGAGCIIAELLAALNTGGRIPSRSVLFPGGPCTTLSGCVGAHVEEMDRILDVLGSPFEEVLFEALPAAAKADLLRYPPRNGAGLASLLPCCCGEDSLWLLEQMLRFFPESRISMASAVQHPFFDKVRRRTGEGRLPPSDILRLLGGKD